MNKSTELNKIDHYEGLTLEEKRTINYLLGRKKKRYRGSCFIKQRESYSTRFVSILSLINHGFLDYASIKNNIAVFRLKIEYWKLIKYEFLKTCKK